MANQREKILQILEDRGEAGVLNIELNEIAFRYGGRLHELRQDGYRIRTTHIKNSVWRFTLLRGDDQPTELAAELNEPQYLDFLEMMKPSPCCGEIVVDGMCGGCYEHI